MARSFAELATAPTPETHFLAKGARPVAVVKSALRLVLRRRKLGQSPGLSEPPNVVVDTHSSCCPYQTLLYGATISSGSCRSIFDSIFIMQSSEDGHFLDQAIPRKLMSLHLHSDLQPCWGSGMLGPRLRCGLSRL